MENNNPNPNKNPCPKMENAHHADALKAPKNRAKIVLFIILLVNI